MNDEEYAAYAAARAIDAARNAEDDARAYAANKAENIANAAAANLTELRYAWRVNQREIRACFLSGYFWRFPALNDLKWTVLMPEFERRGFVVRGPGGESLKQPERRTQ